MAPVLFGSAMLIAVVCLGGAVSASALPSASVPTIRITVRDSGFALFPRTARVGLVRFAVVNRGLRPHNFALGGRTTRQLDSGERAELVVRLSRSGALDFRSTIPGDSRRGLRGRLTVLERGIRLRLVARVPGAPVHVTAPPGDVRRLFIVEKQGAIRLLLDGKLLPRPFLDLSALVRSIGNEQGLLSLAFAPDYASTRRFYVYYVDQNENARLVEFRRSAGSANRADPATRRELLVIKRPSGEHYGGHLLFGPDRYLYLSVGDGGLNRDREPRRAQWGDSLNGKILRIDPRPAGRMPYRVPRSNPFVGRKGWLGEIWAIGLRNPWRYWIDPVTKDFFVGDAGEFVIESIDYAPRAQAAGANFGWPCNEGTLRHPEFPAGLCPRALPPLYEYARNEGNCAAIGGLVVRDPRLPAHSGDYLFSDFCRGDIRQLRRRNGRISVESLGIGRPALSSFGIDARRRVYATIYTGGLVFRLDPVL